MELEELPFLTVIALWGNKKWPPIKMLDMENPLNKISFEGCQWSSLNATGTEKPLSHPFLELDDFPFPLLALWGTSCQLGGENGFSDGCPSCHPGRAGNLK